MDIQAKDRIIVALDTSDEQEIRRWIKELRGQVGMFKIGLEALHAIGTQPLKALFSELDMSVFIDCKLHDIPETMRKASLTIVGESVRFFNVHAVAGADGIEAAAKAKGTHSKVLAVTLLTSHSPQDARTIFNADHVERKVVSLATLAVQSGADGIICSPQEIRALREHPATKNTLIITPGVRPVWASSNDQKRVMTPGEAIKAGANYLVIGRPITNNKQYSPFEAAQLITREIEEALASG